MTTADFNITVSKVATMAPTKLRLGSLTALVISMVGSGVFSLPQNMAAGAGPLATLIGSSITVVGCSATSNSSAGAAGRAAGECE
ncbi:hypothetical protein [Mesorhizobium sp. INR15]|uniref:hypothetical protein n=1 Tax=Mesorhizobium sp. INR15 TaxID=2654248 RepID=UPI0018966447|nr:hypothetical protein [Mesorhizobium sp. INR15]QPC95687.1 hypothetical protein GA829_34425 [Mesorhizobium sp. INR15]